MCVLRVAFLAGGVSAVLAGDWLAGGSVYVACSSAATGLAHWWAERHAREAKKQQAIRDQWERVYMAGVEAGRKERRP